MKSQRTKPRGFSLIEMLVVISIIAALAAILIPVLTKAKARAARMGCISNLKQMALALQMYREDWKGVMPYRMGYEAWGADTGWTARLKTYNDTVDLFRCPADFHFFSYGMNPRVMSKATKDRGGVDSVNDPFKESDVRSQTKLIVIYESPGSGVRQPGGGGDVEQGDSDITNEDQPDGWVYGGLPERDDNRPITGQFALGHFHWLYFPGRHNGGNCLLFWDGHANWFHDWDEKKMTFQPDKEML